MADLQVGGGVVEAGCASGAGHDELGGGGHELHEAAGAGGGDGVGVEVGFHAGDCIDEGGIELEAASGAEAVERQADGGGLHDGAELAGEVVELGGAGDEEDGAAEAGLVAGIGEELA